MLSPQKKDSKDSKIEEDRYKAIINVTFNDCRYRVKITYIKEEKQWKITILKSKHNHSMILNPFVFSEHRCRDLSHEEVIQLNLGLRTAFIKFKQVKRIMQTQRLNIDLKTFYNLIRLTSRKTSQEQLNLALKILKLEDFHVRYLKKYVVENEVRKHQVIEHFFFCNTNQIRYARRFVFGFVI